MATIEKQRERLITLLGDLFQLNQPDLDFGFYRIMHAKADRVSSFLQNDLLKIIKDAFGAVDEQRVTQARQAYEAAINQAKEFGALKPEETEPVKKAKAAYDALRDTGNGEGEIYDHLFRFFERYYDSGDFMSRRYYARETDGKAAPYSVPYDGREVYLHWANRDQYYIKTSEYLTNFTFDVAKFFITEERAALSLPDTLKLHCRIVDAAEGEHGNVKATDKTERYFLIHKAEPVKIDNGDLIIQFEYRPDAEKSGQGGKWQDKRLEEAEALILQHLPDGPHWTIALNTKIGEQQDRTLLRRYLNQYTSRNTMDYFIHKDLGGFLRRELDFYIKNEIMRLDDIESADVPRVDFYLSKIKVLRKIAHHLIDFLAQLEDFQKKLWLKKKFVVETNYCITLDHIPENLYPEIAANDAQREEWVKLFAIDELPGYTTPLSTGFLKNNPFLVLDTAFFDETFQAKVLAGIQGLDEKCGGLLVNSENHQAARLIKDKYSEQIKAVYNDPPYNTSEETFIYKNSYKHSSWLSMIANTFTSIDNVMTEDGIYVATIDDAELYRMKLAFDGFFGEESYIGTVAIQTNPRGRGINSFFATSHDYAIFYAKEIASASIQDQLLTDAQADGFKHSDGDSAYRLLPFRRSGGLSTPDDRPNSEFSMYYSLKEKNIVAIGGARINEYPADYLPSCILYLSESGQLTESTTEDFKRNHGLDIVEIMPIDSSGNRRVWRWSDRKKILEAAAKGDFVVNGSKNSYSVLLKDRIKEGRKPKTMWFDSKYDGSSHGTNLLKEIVGERRSFGYPKSLYNTLDCLHCIVGNDPEAIVLDCFGGSGTTGHAVSILNASDEGNRKFVLFEMGDYFYTVTKPRIQKVTYSRDWKDGKPVSRDGISHCFKYIRLESYEDALNNLVFRDDDVREQALKKHDDFRREYMLKYWLDLETKGSPSLLSIEQFSDPTAYKLKIKKPGSDEYTEKAVDLLETFNWLIGLHVDHIDAPCTFGGKFKREADPELPNDQTTRLILDGKLTEDANGQWWFRKVEGRICRTPGDKTNMDKVLIIWRKLTGNLEEDNVMLDEWFQKYRLSTQDTEFDVIYVNGSNNLSNLKRDDKHWKVRLIEETFHQKMWDVEG